MALRGDDLSTGHWKKQRLRVLARDGWTCTYCGEPATEVDHVIPRKVGGGHDMDNLVASCRACNLRKGARSEGLFLLKGSELHQSVKLTDKSLWLQKSQDSSLLNMN